LGFVCSTHLCDAVLLRDEHEDYNRCASGPTAILLGLSESLSPVVDNRDGPIRPWLTTVIRHKKAQDAFLSFTFVRFWG